MARNIRRPDAPDPVLDGSGLVLAIVCGRFNDGVTAELLAGAQAEAERLGVERVETHWVPGAYELPLAARLLAESGAVDAVVALGCVIRGATPHFDYVAGECARGLMEVQLATGVPVAFGVLTTEDLHQALTRAGVDQDDKGAEAVQVAVEMAAFRAGIGTDA